MTITRAKLKNLEKRIKQKKGKSAQSALKIPSNWADFARMTTIRSGGDIKPFDPYDYQIKLVELMLERSVVVVKSRQLGISETLTAFMLWRACLNPGYLGLVFSKTQADSSLLARRMKRMIASLGLKTTTENLSDIEILGYGRILFRNSKPDSARGIESVVDVFIDEAAFLENGKEIYDALAPSQQMLGDKGRVFVVSTPCGRNGFFWDLLTNGNGDKNVEIICNRVSKNESEPFQYWVDNGNWCKVLIHWKTHPLYGSDEQFLQKVHENQKLSWATIEQEYNLNFQESETSVFDLALVQAGAIGWKESLGGEVEKGVSYYCGLDTATVGQDYCVLSVLKETDGKYSLVNWYRKRQETSEVHMFKITEYLEACEPKVIAVEVTGGVGEVYLEQLSRQLPHLNFQAIRTTQSSKPSMIANLQLALEKTALIYPPDSPLVEELLSFRRAGKKLEAASGKHDDFVMSVAFALSVSPFNKREIGFTTAELEMIRRN